LKDEDVWEEIRKIRPRSDYDDLLRVILAFAPDKVLKGNGSIY